tara:strand:+ start:2876 stop:3538 length:663 start_codon:yes stop_codon:yes gene_type:complete
MSLFDYPPYYTNGDYFHSIGTSKRRPKSSRELGENERIIRNYGWRADILYESHKTWIVALKSAHDVSSFRCSVVGCTRPASEGCHIDYSSENRLFLGDSLDELEIEGGAYVIVPICFDCHQPSRASDGKMPISVKNNTPCILDTGSRNDLLSNWYFYCERCNTRLELADGSRDEVECLECGFHHQEEGGDLEDSKTYEEIDDEITNDEFHDGHSNWGAYS